MSLIWILAIILYLGGAWLMVCIAVVNETKDLKRYLPEKFFSIQSLIIPFWFIFAIGTFLAIVVFIVVFLIRKTFRTAKNKSIDNNH